MSNPWVVNQNWGLCQFCGGALGDCAFLYFDELYCHDSCAIVDHYDPSNICDGTEHDTKPEEISRELYLQMQFDQAQVENTVRFVSDELIASEMHSTFWILTLRI